MYVVYARLCLQYFHVLLLAQCPQYFSATLTAAGEIITTSKLVV